MDDSEDSLLQNRLTTNNRLLRFFSGSRRTDESDLKERRNNYVALSYTWVPSAYEDDKSGRYLVEDRNRNTFSPSDVRDCVLDRITKYMKVKGVKLLWIDRHSIPQQTCEDPTCRCWPCNQKRQSLQSMDQVYQLSEHPVALLGRPISSEDELEIFCKILEGAFVTKDDEKGRWKFEKTINRHDASHALRLLYEITKDLWWQRAWTFQENYKGGTQMILLIPHPESLEIKKLIWGVFGYIPGELSIKSTEFSDEATKFCQAFRGTPNLTEEDSCKIKYILSRTEKYTVSLKESEPMYPAIIANVQARDITDPWDRIPIIANCCSYPVRLDAQKLKKRGDSLSLAILATCLLNGEILNNKPLRYSKRNLSVSQFLNTYCFKEIRSPPEVRRLTYNKGCRFNNVELTEVGIKTKGHLWELGQIIRTAGFENQLPFVRPPNCDRIELGEYRRLTRLHKELKKYHPCRKLADDIGKYLRSIDVGKMDYDFGENYMLMMAVEVAKAIEEGKTLRLGRLCEPDDTLNPYSAIFVWGDTPTRDPAFVFTSLHHSWNDTDRHVSLQVDLRDKRDDTPQLYVNRWLLGMCFFRGELQRRVVFPWPPALVGPSHHS
ncbi:uncharacterized protein F4812DRAFT_454274 [Daldinia caldariorum]|uniref:uncharacterized protein n=1 Tax=Daldinia caldariorum TaxID=326644 RepID=UPI0020072A81|nr:uncharacterized protein F4812DRAFT_454274 [Daldinia caldariorum]KAI1472460.1 hypothetical protein F4812DRAFT_454274 [Daldinia caldariorum]